jgi:hypothetical protein
VVAACDHHGCRPCFKPWLSARGNCPVCRGVATIKDLRDASRTTRNILAAWRVACGVPGCKETLPFEGLAAHEAACPKRREPCAWCGKAFLAGTVVSHEAGCARKPAPCPRGCGALVPPTAARGKKGGSGAASNKHDCVTYLKGRLKTAESDAGTWMRLFTNGASLASNRLLEPPDTFNRLAMVRLPQMLSPLSTSSLFLLNPSDEADHADGGTWGDAFGRLLEELNLDEIATVSAAWLFESGPQMPPALGFHLRPASPWVQQRAALGRNCSWMTTLMPTRAPTSATG